MKNKGFTLMELIVAIAIGSIVILMVSVMLVRGTSIFRTENDEVNMRNDYQIVRNQIDQVLMEAKTLIIENRIDSEGKKVTIIYTGDVVTDNASKDREFSSSYLTTERVIRYEHDTQRIYISGGYENSTAEGNCICDIVKEFSIALDDSSKRSERDSTGAEIIYYVNPMRVNVTLSLGNKNSDMNSSFSVNLRNRLSSITFYNETTGAELLNAVPDVKTYKVK